MKEMDALAEMSRLARRAIDLEVMQIEAEARIERLETALAAVVYGGLVAARYVTSAAEVLNIDVNLGE